MWENWSDCSVSCGRGSKSSRRRVIEHAQNGGLGCSGGSQKFTSCKTQPCPGDINLYNEFFKDKIFMLRHVILLDIEAYLTHS